MVGKNFLKPEKTEGIFPQSDTPFKKHSYKSHSKLRTHFWEDMVLEKAAQRYAEK